MHDFKLTDEEKRMIIEAYKRELKKMPLEELQRDSLWWVKYTINNKLTEMDMILRKLLEEELTRRLRRTLDYYLGY